VAGGNVDGRYRAIWLIVAQGGWWKTREIKESMPLEISVDRLGNYLWVMTNRTGHLVSRGSGEDREYSLAPSCKMPMELTVQDVVGALVGQDTATTAARSDLWLMRQALSAIDGLIEVGEHRGVKPTDITLTIRAGLRRRLANSALQRHEWGNRT
jgi:hypothetical protein